jgi:hypothetical protein
MATNANGVLDPTPIALFISSVLSTLPDVKRHVQPLMSIASFTSNDAIENTLSVVVKATSGGPLTANLLAVRESGLNQSESTEKAL